MFDAAARLSSLHVGDVMNRHVFTVSANATMAEAAGLMRHEGISGAPVVNAQGKFVGILSASDFVRLASMNAGQEDAEMTSRLERFKQMEWGQEWFTGNELAPNLNLVGFHMTPAVQGIPATATLLQAAHMMCSLHVHRLPVLTGHGELTGMITSLDVVAALVNAMQEAKPTAVR